ncbi:drug/metabolite transporter (DMT)-like permease [Actinomadura coerulea]|uniref:Drug/metabolite transporter (DMT)-like permease n=1 Tax=Actinomadura coerulea TaxID=46159 RepID=A0A7X0FW92_9ACTN|nr:DMT family transporter [Actinomadura coerulea]MBB6394868.1 drug/metabolite transporter (DMT)-like permease [Actinomadura coerulea]GGQ31488.1 membrane protein [Actinomadura coerulea]
MDGATRTRAQGLALALLSSVCFGASGPFGKALIEAGLGPLQAVWLRIAVAALVLAPLPFVLRGRAAVRGLRPHLPALALYGLTGVAGCQAFYFVAASRLPVGVAILLEFSGPVIVLAWLRLVRRAPVHRTAAAGVAIAMAGLALVVQVWTGLSLDPVGLAAGLGAAACQASYFLIVDRLAGQVDPVAIASAGSVVAAVALTALAAPWTLPWQVLPAEVPVGGHAAPGWVLVAVIGLVSTVLAYLTGVAGLQRLSAQVGGAICYTEAVAAALIAWAALGERLTAAQLTGGVIVLAGAYIAQRATVAHPEVLHAAAPADRPPDAAQGNGSGGGTGGGTGPRHRTAALPR